MVSPPRWSLSRLVWANLWARPLVSVLNLLLLTLGFAAMSFVVLVSEQLEQGLQRDLAGIDLVVGAKGSPLQLILAGVFHLDAPTGNIPASAQAQLAAHPMVAQVVPLALGDSVRGYRIVGTTPDYPALYGATMAQGQWGPQALQAVLGAEVARRTGWRVGSQFTGSHGLGSGGGTASPSGLDHEDSPFTVAGVLEPTGTVIDRLVLTPVDSVWRVHEHHEHHEHHEDHEDHAEPEPEREVTLLLVRYRTPMAAVSLPRWVNAQAALQSASPVLEAARLFRLMGVGIEVLQGFGLTLLLVACLSVFIGLSHAVNERQSDLAMMRLLGASAWRVSLTVALEALVLAGLGAVLGLVLGHGLVHALGWTLAEQAGLPLTGAWWSPLEAWLLPLALSLGLLACLGPTWRAYRTPLLPILSSPQGR